MNWRQVERRNVEVADLRGSEYSSPLAPKTEVRRFAADENVDRLELRPIDGDALMVARPDGRYTMFLNKNQPRVRHRFSVAHEIAHLLLSSSIGEPSTHRRFTPEQDPHGKRVEMLCNNMASAILMPSERVLPIMNSTKPSARCVPTIVKRFDVSFEAAARRFVNLSSDRCAVMFWKPQGSKGFQNLKGPVCNSTLGNCWIELTPSTPNRPIEAARALYSKGIVMSFESVVVTRRRRRATPERVDNIQVESFGYGRGRYQHVVSFVRLPPTT